MRNRFVSLEGGSEEKAKHWVMEVLLWSRMEVRKNKEEAEFAFVQYMKCSLSRANVDKVLGYASLLWRTDDDTYHILAKDLVSWRVFIEVMGMVWVLAVLFNQWHSSSGKRNFCCPAIQ